MPEDQTQTAEADIQASAPSPEPTNTPEESGDKSGETGESPQETQTDSDFFKRVYYRSNEKIQSIDCTTEEDYKMLASEGARSIAEEHLKAGQTPPPEPENKPPIKSEPKIVPDENTEDFQDDDHVSRQIRELSKQVTALRDDNEKMRTETEQERTERQGQEKKVNDQQYMDRLAGQYHVDQASAKIRRFVEVTAWDQFNEAAQARRPIPFDEAYKTAVNDVGSVLRDDRRDWIEGKKRVAATAVEAPGGTPGILPATPSLPEDKAAQRKLAEEMTNGVVRKRAFNHWERLTNQAVPEAVSA